MRSYISISTSTLLILIASLFIASDNNAQIEISAKEWQEDLTFLQNTIHKDYPFLFKKTTSGDFDKKVSALHDAIPEMFEHEIIIGLAKIVSSFEYGHTSLSLGGDQVNFHRLPLNLYHFKDGVYIEGIHRDYEDLIGLKLLEIEGMPILDVLAAVKPVFPSENDQFYKGYGLSSITVPEILHAQGITKSLKTDIEFTLEKDGKPFTKKITASRKMEIPRNYGFINQDEKWQSCRNQSETPLYLMDLEKNYYYKYLPDTKAVYVRYSQVVHDETEPIPDFFARVFDFIDQNDVEKLILDVRLNGGGDNFNNKTLVTKIIETKKINEIGKFFVIIGRRTYSACQNLINEFDNYTNAVFVGEPSGENINFYGDNRTVTLPNSEIPIRLSWAWWQDKPQWQNADWTEPHLAVELSFAEYESNEDPILQRAIDFEQSDFILDPMDYLSGLFMSRKIDLLESEARRMVSDPDYAFFDFEREFEKVGIMLLNSKQLEGAMFIFNMNTQFFPESINSKFYLAETLVASEKTNDALGLYEMVVNMEPESEMGLNAAERIKEIRNK